MKGPLDSSFVYRVAIMDWYSRRVLCSRVSNSMDASFWVDCLEDAIHTQDAPEIFNSDQGSQFTSADFTEVLKREGVQISTDGRGHALVNIFTERFWRSVKYEDVYLKGYSTMPELMMGLTNYFVFYNSEHLHQSLGYRAPDSVYPTVEGGGGRAPDHFSDARGESPASLHSTGDSRQEQTGQHCSAIEEMDGA
jgi:putative transposase